MQRHIEHDKRRQLPLVIPICFITVAVVLTPGPCAGWTNCRPDYCTETLYCSVPAGGCHVVPDDEIVQHRRVALLELIQSIFASAI